MKKMMSVVLSLAFVGFASGCRALPERPATESAVVKEPVVTSAFDSVVREYETKLNRTLTPRSATKLLGEPNKTGMTSSDLVIYVYTLKDGAELWLGFPGLSPIAYAKIKTPSGTFINLQLK